MPAFVLFKMAWTAEAVLALVATTTSDLPDLAKYGVLGIIVVALLVGWLVPGYIYKALTARAEASEERERKLQAAFDSQTLPLLTELATNQREVISFMHEVLGYLRTRSAS